MSQDVPMTKRANMLHPIEVTLADIEEVAQALGLYFDDKCCEVLQCTTYRDIQACPGSGKTTLLVAKLAVLAKKWTWRDRGICVLSHTNVARQEIEKHLANHPAAHRLLGYPHFIGTIQVFVDQFLALPYLRSKGVEDCTVDDERFAERAWALFEAQQYTKARVALSYRDKKYPGTSWKLVTGLRLNLAGGQFELESAGGDLKLKNKTKPTYKQLFQLKRQMWCEGIFRYDDMYAFAEAYLNNHPWLVEIMRLRFPWVFIDEMQDTVVRQDQLLSRVFGGECIVQRFGDINQAIYQDETKEETRTTFPLPGYIDLPVSRRFGPTIATLVSPLTAESPQELVGNTEVPSRRHTIFLFDISTIRQVLPAFGDLLAQEYRDGLPEGFKAKAIGFRKGKPQSQDTRELPYNIGDYWQYFQPGVGSKSDRPGNLVDYVRKARHTREKQDECGEAYDVLVQGVLEFLHRQGARNDTGARFTKTRLMDALAECGDAKDRQFRELLLDWCFSEQVIDLQYWQHTSQALVDLTRSWCRGVLDNETKEYLQWTEGDWQVQEEEMQLPTGLANVYRYKAAIGTIEIELATIHAVKGETHTATLVLETYWHDHDLKVLLPYMTGNNKTRPRRGNRNYECMKRVFVGATRPKELLCLAMHREHLDAQHIQALSNKGWSIRDVAVELSCVER